MPAMSDERPISESVWEAFFTKDGKYDGRKFEDLSLLVLKARFGGHWEITKASHDGNKDFVCYVEGEEMWAECKAYKDRVSYHVISPTLFMAIIGDPRRIIFISRSALNRNTKLYLSDYQLKTGKQIICLDGTILDQLILSNSEIYDKFFLCDRPATHPPAPLFAEASATPLLTSEPPSSLSNKLAQHHNPPSKKFAVGLGDVIQVNLTLFNNNPTNEVQIDVSLTWTEQSSCATKILARGSTGNSQAWSVILQPGEIYRKAIYLEAVSHGPEQELPKVAINYDGESRNLELGLISISRLYRIGLVGKVHKKIRKTLLDAAENERPTRIFCVSGTGGTGKSHLLRTIADQLVPLGFNVYQRDGEFSSPQVSDILLKSLLAQLNDFPLVPTDDDHSEVETHFENGDHHNLMRMIYEKDSALLQDAELVAKAIICSVKRRPTAIIVDNVQGLESKFVSTLNAVVDLVSGESTEWRLTHPLILIFAFNTELLVPSSEPDRFRAILKYLSKSDEERATASVIDETLCEFDTDDAVEFLEQALASEEHGVSLANYPKTVNSFKQFVRRTPLMMWETLRYLRDTGVISLSQDLLVVGDTNDSSIAEILRNTPTELRQLLERRWERILDNHSRSSNALPLEADTRTAALLGCFTREVYQRMAQNTESLDCLVQIGILVDETRAGIRFVHQQVFQFFFARSINRIAASEASFLSACFRELRITDLYYEQYFILIQRSGQVTEEDLVTTVELLSNRGGSPEYIKSFADTLLFHLLSTRAATDELALNGYAYLSEALKSLVSLRASYEVLERSYKQIVAREDPTTLPTAEYLNYIHLFINGALATRQDIKARELVDLALKQIESLAFRPTSTKDFQLALLLDRRQSILKNFPEFVPITSTEDRNALPPALQLALEDGEVVQRITSRAGPTWLRIDSLFNTAELYFHLGSKAFREEAFSIYEKGLECFEMTENRWELMDPVPVRTFVATATLSLGNGDWRNASEVCAQGIGYAMRVRNHFWCARLYVIGSAAQCIGAFWGEVETRFVADYISRSQDTMNVYQSNRYSWLNHYMLGKLRAVEGDYYKMAESFRAAVESLVSACGHEGDLGTEVDSRINSEYDAFIDMAIELKRRSAKNLLQIFSAASGTHVHETCYSIAQMNSEQFACTLADWKERVFYWAESEESQFHIVKV